MEIKYCRNRMTVFLFTNRLLQAYYSSTQMPPPTALSPADSRLNSTFTKEPDTPALVKAPPISYEMTPAENDPLYGYENYDIANLSASDSTDDDEDPKKVCLCDDPLPTLYIFNSNLSFLLGVPYLIIAFLISQLPSLQ